MSLDGFRSRSIGFHSRLGESVAQLRHGKNPELVRTAVSLRRTTFSYKASTSVTLSFEGDDGKLVRLTLTPQMAEDIRQVIERFQLASEEE